LGVTDAVALRSVAKILLLDRARDFTSAYTTGDYTLCVGVFR